MALRGPVNAAGAWTWLLWRAVRTHQTQASPQSISSVDQKEARKFAELAGQWWNPAGPFAPLHRLNPTRCKFIRDATCAIQGCQPRSAEAFAGLRILDVGCGGGILSESLARMGGDVHGIDITDDNIAVARLHASQDPQLQHRLRYECITLERLAERVHSSRSAHARPSNGQHHSSHGTAASEGSGTSSSAQHSSTTAPSGGPSPPHVTPCHSSPPPGAAPPDGTADGMPSADDPHDDQQPQQRSDQQQQQPAAPQHAYDVVVASEVLEHVRRPDLFCLSLAAVLKPGGTLILSTINRTPASFAVAILGAEYITGLVPRGTHDWHKFITPEELYLMAQHAGLSLRFAAGMQLAMDPTLSRFSLTDDLRVNYIAAFSKPA